MISFVVDAPVVVVDDLPTEPAHGGACTFSSGICSDSDDNRMSMTFADPMRGRTAAPRTSITPFADAMRGRPSEGRPLLLTPLTLPPLAAVDEPEDEATRRALPEPEAPRAARFF